MRYYKTVSGTISGAHVEDTLRKMNHEYPRTFVLHKVSHVTASYGGFTTVATFSWDDDEDYDKNGYIKEVDGVRTYFPLTGAQAEKKDPALAVTSITSVA